MNQKNLFAIFILVAIVGVALMWFGAGGRLGIPQLGAPGKAIQTPPSDAIVLIDKATCSGNPSVGCGKCGPGGEYFRGWEYTLPKPASVVYIHGSYGEVARVGWKLVGNDNVFWSSHLGGKNYCFYELGYTIAKVGNIEKVFVQVTASGKHEMTQLTIDSLWYTPAEPVCKPNSRTCVADVVNIVDVCSNDGYSIKTLTCPEGEVCSQGQCVLPPGSCKYGDKIYETGAMFDGVVCGKGIVFFCNYPTDKQKTLAESNPLGAQVVSKCGRVGPLWCDAVWTKETPVGCCEKNSDCASGERCEKNVCKRAPGVGGLFDSCRRIAPLNIMKDGGVQADGQVINDACQNGVNRERDCRKSGDKYTVATQALRCPSGKCNPQGTGCA